MTANIGIWKLAALGALALSLAGPSLAATEHSAQHHAAGTGTLQLNNGQKWATDAPLRQGMENIRAAMAAALPAIHANQQSNAQYRALAQKINSDVGGIVANCKLAPQADAQLHLIIADLLHGVETMQGKTKKAKRQTGALKVLGALEKYAAYFDHPGWQPIAH